MSSTAFADDSKKADELFEKGFSEVDNKNTKQALTYWEESCSLKHGQACSSAALIYSMGMGGIKKDEKKAYNLYEKACEFQSSEG